MTEAHLLVPALGLVIGILSGMFGGGGSILAVSVFIYLAGLEEKLAVIVSLIVVGVASLVAAWPHNRAGNMGLRTGILFAIGSSVGAFGGAQLQPFLHRPLILISFALLILAAAALILRQQQSETPPDRRPFWIILVQGLGVGVVIGLVGVGGSIAVVPALLLLARLEMKRAVGTSLLVIGLNSASAFAGYFVQRGVLVQIETTMVGSMPLFPYILLLTAVAAGGALIGTALMLRVSALTLRRAFGVLLIGVAALILAQNLQQL